jgi:hypothetical protein
MNGIPRRGTSLYAHQCIPTYNPSTGKHLLISIKQLILLSELDGAVLPGNGLLASTTSFEEVIIQPP